jgi:hypothetical protein
MLEEEDLKAISKMTRPKILRMRFCGLTAQSLELLMADGCGFLETLVELDISTNQGLADGDLIPVRRMTKWKSPTCIAVNPPWKLCKDL